jgi:hypothetical protein
MDNSLLWENYANRYTGFCIEYTIPEEARDRDDCVKHILPVIYKKNIPYFEPSKYVVEKLPLHMLYKHMDYKFEHEWRILAMADTSFLQPFPYVSAIVAGKDITQRNYARLHTIANKIGVPLLRQIFDDKRNRFRYV